MDLTIPAIYKRFVQTKEEVLSNLRSLSDSWRQSIESYAENIIKAPPMLNSAPDNINIDGRPLRSFFDQEELTDFIFTLTSAMNMSQDAKSLIEDVIGIVCLAATMCSNFVSWFQGDDAEASWQQLAKDAGLLVERATETYNRHQKIYDMIFTKLCSLIGPEFLFCIKLAAALFSFIWNRRQSIAKWIAEHWKEVAVGAGAALLGAAVLGLGAYALYKVLRDDKDSRKD